MRRLTKRPAARIDLIDVWFYSVEQWNEAQADNYLDALTEAFAILAEHLRIGVDCSYIRQAFDVTRSEVTAYIISMTGEPLRSSVCFMSV